MIKLIRSKSIHLSAALAAGMLFSSTAAHAGQNWGSIANNITVSLASVPGLITGISYMMGILLGVLGVLKIKDHVENPAQTPLKDGAIRLAAGGALFALPIIYEAMFETMGTGSQAAVAALNSVAFTVQ